MNIMSWLAEQRIAEAMRKGEFERLPGYGKPVDLEEWAGVPEELRMSYTIMKNAGLIPEELALRKECLTLEELLSACRGEGTAEERELRRQLTMKRIRLQELLRQRGIEDSAVFGQYGDRIQAKLSGEASRPGSGGQDTPPD